MAKPREYLHRAGKLTPSSPSYLEGERDATIYLLLLLLSAHLYSGSPQLIIRTFLVLDKCYNGSPSFCNPISRPYDMQDIQ